MGTFGGMSPHRIVNENRSQSNSAPNDLFDWYLPVSLVRQPVILKCSSQPEINVEFCQKMVCAVVCIFLFLIWPSTGLSVGLSCRDSLQPGQIHGDKFSWTRSQRAVDTQYGKIERLVAAHDQTDPGLKASILSSFQRVESSEFQIDRGLGIAFREFCGIGEIDESSHSLTRSLGRLDGKSHILDLGAGVFNFADELTRRFDRQWATRFQNYWGTQFGDVVALITHFEKVGFPQLTGVTLVDLDQKDFKWKPTLDQVPTWGQISSNGKLHPIVGRYFEELKPSELLRDFSGFDLVIDSSGVLAYTLNLPRVLQILTTIMPEGSELWMRNNFQKVIPKDQTEPIGQTEYIGSLPGFEIISHSNFEVKRGAFPLLRRTHDAFVVPDLELISLADGHPPVVTYRER